MEDRSPHSGLDMPYAKKKYKKEIDKFEKKFWNFFGRRSFFFKRGEGGLTKVTMSLSFFLMSSLIFETLIFF